MPQTPAFRAAGAVSFTPNSVATPATLTPGAPAGKTVGDVLFLVCFSRSIVGTVATPTGWSLVTGFPKRSGTASGGSFYLFTRVADGTATDTPSPVWASLGSTGTTGDSCSAVILCYTNAASVTLDAGTIVVSDLSAQTTTSAITGMTTSSPNSLVLSLAAKIIDFSGANSATYTERVDAATTSGTGHGLEYADEIQVAAGASGTDTVTWGTTTSARVLGVTVAFLGAALAAVDANTIQTTTVVTSTDTEQAIDDNSVATTTTVVSTETTQFVESAQILTVSSVLSSDVAAYVDLNTVNMVSSVISSDILVAIEAGTVTAITTPTSAELHEISDSNTITTTTTTVTSTETVQFVDSAQITTTSSVIPIDVKASVDSSTITVSTKPSSSDVAIFVERARIPDDYTDTFSYSDGDLSANPNWKEIFPLGGLPHLKVASGQVKYPPTGSGPAWAYYQGDVYTDVEVEILLPVVPSVINKAVWLNCRVNSPLDINGEWGGYELGMISNGDGTVNFLLDRVNHGGTDLTLDFQSNFAISDGDSMRLRVVGTTITGWYNHGGTWIQVASATDTHWTIGYVGMEIQSQSTLRIDNFSVTSLASTVFYNIQSTTFVSSDEIHEIPDTSTITSSTIITTQDTAQYVEAATINCTTTPTSAEVHEIPDASTPTTTTSVTTLDTAQYVDANTAIVITTPSANEQQSGGTSDANTLKTTTSITYTETAQYVDTSTATSTTSVSTSEVIFHDDSQTIPVKTTPTAADVAAYVDAATAPTTTIPSAVEVGAFTDSATLTSLTSISYVDAPIYGDSDLPLTTTTPTSADVATFTDFNTATTLTSLSALETKTSGNTDFATVTTLTYIITVREGIFLLVDLIPSPLLARWYHTTTLTSRYPVRVFQKWAAGLFTNRYNVNDYKKWVTSWIR